MFINSGNLCSSTVWLESGRSKIVIFLVETSASLVGLFCHISSYNKKKEIENSTVRCLSQCITSHFRCRATDGLPPSRESQ